MKKLITSIIIAVVAVSSHAAIVLYNGELAQAVTTNSGASAFNYDSGVSAYGLHAYNSSNVSYVEEAAGTTFTGFGSGTVLKMTNNGGVDGALRYNGAQARIANFVNSTGSNESPMATDIEANPVLQFDIVWNGDGTFANVIVDTNTNASGFSGGSIITTSLTANVAQTVSVNLVNSSHYDNFLTSVAADGSSTFQQFPRIGIQTASGEAGTFAIDNITLVPEPTTYALLLGLVSLGAIYLRRRRQG